MSKTLLIVLTTAFILISCATSPLGRTQFKLMSAQELNTMGSQAFTQIKEKTPLEKKKRLNRYVNCVGDAILAVSNSPIKNWEIVVFRENSANAFAIPGGKIGVHTGLLKITKTQEQLAAVLGHEVAHVLADHSNERVSQELALQQGLNVAQALGNVQSPGGKKMMALLGLGAEVGVILPYSRSHEHEADEMGLYLMAKAGFDPRESIRLWENMGKGNGEQAPEFFSTHPGYNTRIKRLNQNMNRAMQFYQQAKASGKNPRCRL
jgi:predicted Zn-dependent protease